MQELNLLLELDECQEWIFSVVQGDHLKQGDSANFKKIKAKFSENVEESCGKCSERLHINLFYYDDTEIQAFDDTCDDIDIEEPQAWEPECILQRQDSYEVKDELSMDVEETDFIGFDEPEDFKIDQSKQLSKTFDEETIRNMQIPKSDDKDDPKPFKCPKCEMGFVAQKNVRRHLKNNSCRFPRPFLATPMKTLKNEIQIADDDFETLDESMDEDSLRTLTIPKSTEDDDKKPYKCPKCKLGFVATKNVRRHLKNNSCKSDDIQQGLRPYMCPNCKMRFTTRNNTKKHIARNACGALDSSNGTEPLMVDESDPKPFKCPECGIGFSCRKNVLRHLNANACQMLKGNSGNKRAIDICKAYLPKDLVLPDLSQIKAPYTQAFDQPDGTVAYVSLTTKQAELRVTNFDPNNFTCELCQEILKNTPDLLMHRKAHFFPQNQAQCVACLRTFESSNDKRWHSFYCVDKFKILAE